MPDITLCYGTNKKAFPLSAQVKEDFECPLKETCYRYFEKHRNNLSTWQSYFIGIPYNQETKSCEHYSKNILS